MHKWIRRILPGPRRSERHRKQGNRYLADGDWLRAEEQYRLSIAADPGLADPHVNLGFLLLRQDRLADAEVFLKRALSIDPDAADAHYLLGSLSQKLRRPREAMGHLARALELRPDFAEAHHELGLALKAQGRLDEALRSFDAAISLKPDFSESRLSKSLLLLLRGEFAEGLELFESRLEVCDEPQLREWMALLSRHPERPRWHGGHLGGKTLLVWAEQGAGDCVMAMRYLPKLAEKGAGKIMVLSDPSLTRLIQTLPCVSEVSSRVESLALDSFDAHCPIMSLPFAFGTRLDTIPNAVPYLHVPDAMRRKWRERVAGLSGLKVGLAWAGNRKYGKDTLRSVPLRELRPLIEIRGASFVSLQKGAASGEIGEGGWPIRDWMDECGDFLDTAALAANLDVIVSVDTSVAHLAGALGKPVCLLNRAESEWRWLLDRADSPWYPGLRIFRQSAEDDWTGAVQDLARHLAGLAGSAAPRGNP